MLGPAIVLHGFWLGGRLTNQHVDLLAFWLPRWCYLGSSISAGHIPTWLPNQFAGVPFVSDPQSGWLYAPVMSLFSSMSCSRALSVMIVFNPILAGLGMYVFLRKDGTGRPAATVGGTTLAYSIASSTVALSMPFAGTLAWTAVSLAGAAGYLHARRRIATLGWLGLTAFGLSQVAAAQLTNGLLIAGMVLLPYLLLRSYAQVRAGERRPATAALMAVGLLVAFPVLAAAILMPHLSLLPRTSIGHGYVYLDALAKRLSGMPAPSAIDVRGLGTEWAASFARGVSGYVGVLAIILPPVALASRRWRAPALGFVLAGVAGWLLNLNRFIASATIRRLVLGHRLGEIWLRSPERFKYLLILGFAGAAGYGFQAWLDLEPTRSWKRILARAALWLPMIVLLVLVPIATGRSAVRYVPFCAGLAVAAPLLIAAARGQRWPALALPSMVAIELLTIGLVALTGAVGSGPFTAIRPPDISPVSYLTPGAIGRELVAARARFERYVTIDPTVDELPKGFLGLQDPPYWPAYEDGRAILFGIDEIDGYSPLQTDRYWRLVRRVAQFPIYYNAATFHAVSPQVASLFGVGWVIARSDESPSANAIPVATEGMYTLFQLAAEAPRASVVFDWSRVPPGGGLDLVLAPGFDSATHAIVEAPPTANGQALPSGQPGAATAEYDETTPEHVVVHVSSDAAGLLVVRNAFDRNWHATVDGRAAPVLVTDYLMQGVAVPAGSHTVELVYRDSAVAGGLLLSGAAWAILLGLIGWFAADDRRRRRTRGGDPPSSSPSPVARSSSA